MEVQSKFKTVLGLKTHYLEVGSGEPFVILASMFIRAETYLPLALKLAQRYRVIVVDGPGSGRSQYLWTPWTFEQYANWFEAFLSELNVTNCLAMGHSNSGGALLLAAHHMPSRIEALILADSIGATQSHSLFLTLLRRSMDALLEFSFTMWAVWHLLFNLFFHTRNFLMQLILSANCDLTMTAAYLKVPTLLAWGQQDQTMPLAAAKRFLKCIPQASLYVCEKGSHDWNIVFASEFALAVDSFVSRL